MTTAYAIDVIPTGVYSALNGRMETFKNIQGCFAKIKTVSGRAYRVRTSLNLTQPWSSTASYYYGYGNDITLQIGPPDNITANSPILNPLPHYEFQVASMDSTKSLVSWTSRAADNTLTTYQAVVNLNFTNCPPLSVFLTPPVAPAVTPAYGLSLVSFGLPIKPTPVGGTDPYASLTVAALPAEQQTYLAKLTGNYSALAAQWANPPATPPSIVSGAGVVQGEKQFFQIQEILVDSDGDGLTDDDELAASLNPYDKDTDGDGSPDGEEVLAASDPRDAAQKAYDPSYPAVAHWHVAPISFYYKKLNKDILYETFKGSATTFEAYAASLADGSADAPFLTITAAINAATSGARKGDVIEVAPGTYAESFVIPTNQRVILTARRGSRETTILTAPAGANPNPLISFTSGSSSLVNGFTIQGTSGTALRATSTARSTIANCLISDTGLGLSAEDLSKVVIANSVFAAPRTPLVSGFALTAKGAADVRIAHATFTHAATAAQPQIKGQDIATISLVNSLVWGPNVDVQTGQPAAQTEPPVPSAFPATVDKRETPLLVATYSNFPSVSTNSLGNVSEAPLLGADYRLTRTAAQTAPTVLQPSLSGGIDRGTATEGLEGLRWLTRFDWDGEARMAAYRLSGLPSTVDVGADEYVSRISFPTSYRKGRVSRLYSLVDEASDIAAITTLANGDARLAVINDETVEIADSSGNLIETRNNALVFDLDASTGVLRQTLPGGHIASAALPALEFKDTEAVTYDPANKKLLILNSRSRVNRYRDAETTDLDPLIDPPFNDYDFRRAGLASLSLDAVFAPPTSPSAFIGLANRTINMAAYTGTNDNNTLVAPTTTTSPVDYKSTSGLVGTLSTALSVGATYPELQARSKNSGVLIAWSTSPKFGEPVNGTTYTAGQALPYTSLGGLALTGGTVLEGSAAYNSNATATAAQGITHPNRTVGQTYYYKIWAYDAARNYSRGITASATLDGASPLKVNEVYAASSGPGSDDWIEIYNPSGLSASLNNIWYQNKDLVGYQAIVNGISIPGRSHYRFLAKTTNTATTLPYKLDKDGDRVFLATGSGLGNLTQMPSSYFFKTGQYTYNSEGAAWDGGPTGSFVDSDNLLGGLGIFRRGSVYHGTINSQPVTDNATSNNLANTKFFQAVADHVTKDKVYLFHANIGYEPAVWAYSPKQHDGHPINIEGFAYKSATEGIVGLRSPLKNRTSGNALYFRISNFSTFQPTAADWTTAAAGISTTAQELNLEGQGFRSIQWCQALNGGSGAYLIVGGPANGGPLKNETGREVFSLWQWSGVASEAPVKKIKDLRPYAVRPEGVNVIKLSPVPNSPATDEYRLVFVEDRYEATGYGARNGIHWPLSILTTNVQ